MIGSLERSLVQWYKRHSYISSVLRFKNLLLFTKPGEISWYWIFVVNCTKKNSAQIIFSCYLVAFPALVPVNDTN